MGKTTTWMLNMKKLVGQGELGGVMVRFMMALQEQITRSRSFSAVATCQDRLRQASLDLVRFEVEQAFKELKGDLAIRPVYHQTDERIEAHIFVAFRAYGLQVTLKQRLRAPAPGLTPRAVLEPKAGPQASR
jgi:hypothetical protein